MPQLAFYTYFSQLFWLIITFSLMYLIVGWVFVPCIKKIKKDRQAFMDNNVQEAGEMQTIVAAQKAQYLKELADAEEAAAGILADVALEIEEIKQQKMVELEQSIILLSTKNKSEIDRFKQNYQAELSAVVLSVARIYWEALLSEYEINEANLKAMVQREISSYRNKST